MVIIPTQTAINDCQLSLSCPQHQKDRVVLLKDSQVSRNPIPNRDNLQRRSSKLKIKAIVVKLRKNPNKSNKLNQQINKNLRKPRRIAARNKLASNESIILPYFGVMGVLVLFCFDSDDYCLCC